LDATARAIVVGDRFLLFQAFRNILQNAIEFSGPGSEVDIEVDEDEDVCRIQLVDQGSGIPKFAMARIFEKFYSLERADTKRKSSGLGLSFVKEVIDLHKGQISAESPVRDGRGTRVNIEIPKTT
jgi:two-component system sensor histidine kinase CreC